MSTDDLPPFHNVPYLPDSARELATAPTYAEGYMAGLKAAREACDGMYLQTVVTEDCQCCSYTKVISAEEAIDELIRKGVPNEE